MQLADFDFDLPEHLIAQKPPAHRDQSRLLVIGQEGRHKLLKFTSIVDFFRPGDVLVLNDTKVINARIFVTLEKSQVELFFHNQLSDNRWQIFCKPAKKVLSGQVFTLADVQIAIEQKLDDGQAIVVLSSRGKGLSRQEGWAFFQKHGHVPIPPYIKRAATLDDQERYQTVFAQKPGSVAAPTASLHFTNKILAQLEQKGVQICYLTLHVGAGTFLPVKTQDINLHQMHYENYQIDEQVAATINLAKAAGKRIVASGTTALRALESAAQNGRLMAKTAATNLFIKPGFHFQIVDMLISNFHLPKSTLLMLVSAFAGYETIRDAYNFAIANQLRFFSYGDVSLMYPLGV